MTGIWRVFFFDVSFRMFAALGRWFRESACVKYLGAAMCCIGMADLAPTCPRCGTGEKPLAHGYFCSGECEDYHLWTDYVFRSIASETKSSYVWVAVY